MNDPLFGNKVASAILVALLLIFGLPQIADALFGGHGGGHGELHLAYPIEFETEAAPAEAAPEVDLGTLLASASPEAGERRAGICKSCHTFNEGGANSTGPNLWGVVGRPVASHEGFNYTSALKSFGGEWTYERLNHYIENSQSYVPGTAMVQRFPKPEQRADILAFLHTLSSSPVPFPEPAPPAEEPAEETSQSEAPAATEGELAPESAGGDEAEPAESEQAPAEQEPAPH
ncbi:MAG: cytochrome c family protein [Amphiplicatus sp.]